MASKSAGLIIEVCQRYLGRALTQDEQLQCEELNLNWYTNAILGYVEGLIKKKSPKNFDFVYYPIMNGLLRGAYRRHDILYLRDRMKQVYLKLHAFVGDGMSNAELEACIFMAEDCSDKEIDSALAVARLKGVHHLKYVRAVIEGNRKAVSRRAMQTKLRRFVPTEHERRERVSVPMVPAIREAWRHRLNDAKEKIRLVEAELNAQNRSNRE